MKRKFEEVFSTSAFVGYMEEVLPELVVETQLESLFPVRVIEGLDYSYIKTSHSAVELTAPSAFDAEPIAQHREGFDAMKGELPLFRRKMVLSEKEKSLLKMYAEVGNEQGIDRVLANIYDDQATLVNGALMTQEYLRALALMNGEIIIDSKGGAVSVNYGIPANHRETLSGAGIIWSDPTAKIIDDIIDWCDIVEEDTGSRPTRIIMNRNTFKYIVNNDQIKANLVPLSLLGTASITENVIITDAQVKATLMATTGLSDIMIYNKKVQMDGTVHDLIPNDQVTLMPSEALGNTMVGSSPAELNMADANASGAQIAIMTNGIAVNNYTNTRAPYTSGTEVEFVGLPSFTASDRVFMATVA